MKKHFYIIFVFLFMLILPMSFILPLSLSVHFYQNDDWVHVKVVNDFLAGNFKLDDYIGPTFYTQGLLGMAFAKIAGISNLPVLTLIISLFTLYYIFKILLEFLKTDPFTSLLLSLLIYFSPINIYSLWGFMTEYYLLFFIVSSTYYFLKYDKSQKTIDFLICLILITAGFFVKQNMLLVPITFTIYYLINKDLRNSIKFVTPFLTLAGYYFLIFPKTTAMIGKSFAFNHIFEPKYVFAVFYGSLIVLSAFILPLLFGVIESEFLKGKKKIALIILTSCILLFIASKLYFPNEISWGEFPYFENTFERTGFYPRGLEGTKYQFRGIFDLYKYWDLTAKIVSITSLVFLVFSKKIKLNIYIIFIILYISLLAVLDRYFDRYLINVIPFTVFYIASIIDFNKLKYLKPVLITFLMFLIFYTVQFSIDFIKVNNYVWQKSLELVRIENISEDKIYASHAWNYNYSSSLSSANYYFTYDSPDVNPELLHTYELYDEFKIEYPLNIFIEPKVYLYKRLL